MDAKLSLDDARTLVAHFTGKPGEYSANACSAILSNIAANLAAEQVAGMPAGCPCGETA